MRGFGGFGLLYVLWVNSRPQRWRGVVSPCVTKHRPRRRCTLAAAQLASLQLGGGPLQFQPPPVTPPLLHNPVALTVSPFWTQGALCTQDGLPIYSNVCFLGEDKQELEDQVLATKRKISVGPEPNLRWKKKKKRLHLHHRILSDSQTGSTSLSRPLQHFSGSSGQSSTVSFVWQFY